MMRRTVFALGLLLIIVSEARADALDRVREQGVLRWGADQEGGGPYVYPSPDDPRKQAGFEVDLMELLAQQLGVRAEFRQCEWTNLPDLLRTASIEAVVNGYELTAARQQTMIATMPYYIYELQLMARRDDETIRSWDDLKAAGSRRKKVGLLQGSGAETYVRNRFGSAVEIVGYTGSTDAMLEVQNGKLDATVQDLPPAIFYRDRYPKLNFVGPPVGRGYYVIYLRPADVRLRDALTEGLGTLIQDGRLRAVYERYGLWNEAQEGLAQAAAPTLEQSTQLHGWAVIRRNWPLLRDAAAMTVCLTVLAMPLAITLGLLVALGRLYGPWPVRWLLACYVEVLRGTPLLLQLFTIFFILPGLGISLDAFWAAILGLAINYSAYEAEIYRAGLMAIPVGQMEAALALGMSRRVALRRVIVPQAVRLVVPPVTNDFIALFKDTSVCSVITVVELTKQYNILANSTGAYLEMAAVTALLYLLMSYPLSLLARRLERRAPRVSG
jgi:polar amino acid transport system substrate-binding protein